MSLGQDVSLDLPLPSSVLAIGAHPDDIEFECGASLAKWGAAGAAVHFVVCTDGSKGTWDVDADTNALIARRAAEQQAAAQRIHRDARVHLLSAVDGELTNTVERRGQLARIIRETSPDIVLGHDPWRRWRMHPDHRAAGFLTVDAVVAARDPHYHRDHMADGLTHHRPTTLLLFECEEPNHVESLGSVHLDAKVEALLSHRSQFETTMAIDSDDDGSQAAAFAGRIRSSAHEQGHIAGVELGEAFRVMDPAS